MPARRTRRGPRNTPLETYLRRRRRRGPAWLIVTLAILAALAWADRERWLLYDGDDLSRYDGKTFRVAHVVDGDTLHVAARDGDSSVTRVRLWGINAPEMSHPGLRVGAEPLGDEATHYLRELAEGRTVKLVLEPHRVRDRYERVLAFVELPDGRVLNEEMLAAGLARADDRWAHRRQDRFALLEQQARHDARGIWQRAPPQRQRR